jgi:hypothetical protein
MPKRTRPRPRVIRAVRTRRAAAATPPAQPGQPELSNYELLEVRSRELEAERAHGGTGTSQPPDADTPLLLRGTRQAQSAKGPPAPEGKASRRRRS